MRNEDNIGHITRDNHWRRGVMVITTAQPHSTKP